MITLEKINKYYHSAEGKFHALKDISLTLPDQGMVYIVGKSGSGKSTLLNVIGGIDKYDSGDLIIENTTINEDGTTTSTSISTKDFTRQDFNAYRNTYIGFIFQEFNVIKGLTVYENIALSLDLQQISVKDNNQKILDIIEKVGLKGKEKRRINELSGGERQRVAIARSLIKDPKIIIADEPTGNLDSRNRDIVMDILKELSKTKLILIVTHDKTLAGKYGDREIQIKDGQIISDVIMHQENLTDILPSNHKLEPISPKVKVSLGLAWKGFKLNKVRFILIIVLFAVSLLFSNLVVNLSLVDTTKEYSKYQSEYDNEVITLSSETTYNKYTFDSGFDIYFQSENKKYFKDSEGENLMDVYSSMKVDLNINKNSTTPDDTYVDSIQNIIIYNNTQAQNFKFVKEDIYSDPTFPIYITDYLLEDLNKYGFLSSASASDAMGKTLKFDNFSVSLTIVGVIDTNYEELNQRKEMALMDNDEDEYNKLQASFEDNLNWYNAIFMTETTYDKLFTKSRVNYVKSYTAYFEQQDTKPTFADATYKIYTYSDTIVKGQIPVTPVNVSDYRQCAVSKGFIEQVVGISYDSLTESGGYIYNGEDVLYIRICGTTNMSVPFSFVVTGLTENEEAIVYTPLDGILYSGILENRYTYGGYLTVKISDDADKNSEVYRTLIDNDIIIDNPSFSKLLLVDSFINDNLLLFAALFFSFALFAILMIFNFVIINIKNSTRDIGIYMSLGMNGFKISLIYLFQVLFISIISLVIGIIGSTIALAVIDGSFASDPSVIVNFSIIKNTFIGLAATFGLAFLTPIIAIASPLLKLSKQKPIDVIKVS